MRKILIILLALGCVARAQTELKFEAELRLEPLQHAPFVSAASGLVQVGDDLFVVDDDSISLGIFSAKTLAPGRSIPLFRRRPQSGDKEARKVSKPDLESLAWVETSGGSGLLAFGSGSSPHRNTGVFLRFSQGRVTQVLNFDLTPLYEKLGDRIQDLNVEGLASLGETLRLVHRGNSARGSNAIVDLDLETVMQSAQRGRAVGPEALKSISEVELGAVEGVPWTFTDLAPLGDGRSLFLAAAEDTDDPYSDGEILGSAVGILEADGTVTGFRAVSNTVKLEGVHVQKEAQHYQLWMVSDPDSKSTPARIYRLSLPL